MPQPRITRWGQAILVAALCLGSLRADPPATNYPPAYIDPATGSIVTKTGGTTTNGHAIGGGISDGDKGDIEVSDSGATFSVSDAFLEKSLSQFTGGSYAVRDLKQLGDDSIDNRISGLTAGSSAQNLYSTLNHAGSVYVRSSTWFGHDVDFTAASVYNEETLPAMNCVAVSPRHVVFAYHTTPLVGDVLRFVTLTNTVVTRTISSLQRAGSTDIYVGKLDSDLPSTISFAYVLKSDAVARAIQDSFAEIRAAGFVTDQNQKAFVAETNDDSLGTISMQLPDTSPRSTFWKSGGFVSGDSGHPMGIIVDGRMVLLGLTHGAATNQITGDSIAHNYAAVNSAMTTLGGGYQLTPFNLTVSVKNDGTRAVGASAAGDLVSLNSSGKIASALIETYVIGSSHALADGDDDSLAMYAEGGASASWTVANPSGFRTAIGVTTLATDVLWDAVGDIAYGTGANTGAKLAGNTTAFRKFLSQLGDGVNSATPEWRFIALNEITDFASDPTSEADFDAGNWRSGLGLVISSTVQAYDADLTSWAAITRASGFDTFTATPSGANLASLLTTALPVSKGGTNATSASITAFNNITGLSAAGTTGTTSTNLVFSTSPTITTPAITTGINDTNGNSMLAFTATASAVDGFTFTNAATASPATVTMAATGSDSNISIALTPKGTGGIKVGSGTAGNNTIQFGAVNTGIWSRYSGAVNISVQASDVIEFSTIAGEGVKINQNAPLAFSSSGISGASDAAIYRETAGMLQVTNTPSKISGTSNAGSIKALTFIPAGTATTCTGGTIGTGSKSNAGFVTATTTGTSTIVVTFPVTAPTGWTIMATDITSGVTLPQTAKSTTTATFAGVTSSGDVIQYLAFGY